MPRVPGEPRLFSQYGAAFMAVAMVSLLHWGMAPWLGPFGVLVFYFPALIIVAFYGGLGPGLLATGLSSLIVGIFFVASPALNPWISALPLALFVVSGVMLSFLGQSLLELRRQTERSRENQRLREAEERHRLALEAGRMGSWEWNIQTNQVIWSENLELMHGFAPGSFPGTFEAYLKTVHPDDREMVQGALQQAISGNDDYNVEFRNVHPDGSVHWTLGKGRVLRDAQRHPIRVIGVCMDITARKQAEAALRQAKEAAEAARHQAEAASRLKDEFLANLSHELRTPLNAMLGWARLLRGGELDTETTEQAIDAIERNAKAQGRLVEDLLDVSRIISGKLRLDVREVDLVVVIDAAIQSVQPAADAKCICLERHLEKPVCRTWGDATRLQQVVWNLLSNAIKFTPRGGRVQIFLQRSASHVQISIADTGKGISAEFLPYVFDRFSQADGSSTRVHGGLGLGLAIVRHLVELHGGTVEAFSQGQGQGATFTVRLPIAAVKLQTPTEPACLSDTSTAPFECPAQLNGLRILVVDDEPDACQLIKTVLQRCHAEVQVAMSAAQAMQILPVFEPDVLISDIGMPEEDGHTLMRNIRSLPNELGRTIPAIALTAFARVEDRIKALSSGFQMHIPKPVDPAELVMAVASVSGQMAIDANNLDADNR